MSKSLFEVLQQHDGFEARAPYVLQVLREAFDETLEQASIVPEDAMALRAAIHLRVNDDYRAEASQDYSPDSGREPAGLDSMAVWRWVQTHRGPLVLDIMLRCLCVEPRQLGGRVEILYGETMEETPISASLELLLGREATHILILPLISPHKAIIGMITMEILAPTFVGMTDAWVPCLASLQAFVHSVAPYLYEEDAASTTLGSEFTDALLPVIGSRMASRIKLIARFARQHETLLITGPSGVGKSRLARWCHHQSSRSESPFETLDLLSVPEEMQMAEFVGWEKGAFTGATQAVAGALERARGGTLFVDEIDKLSLKTQAGLLRVLDEGTFRVLGSRGQKQNADIRFIVGTNADLLEAIQEGRFREDLYWRINILPIALRPLDERRDEIAPWAQYMLDRAASEQGLEGLVTWHAEALSHLGARTWPGNLRQLDNVTRRALVIAHAHANAAPERAPLVVSLEAARAAMLMEGRTAKTSSLLVDALDNAALRFVDEIYARRALGLLAPNLDHAAAFRGLVLEEAQRRTADRTAAFDLVGMQHLVEQRNHNRVWKREQTRLTALRDALATPDDP